jgi:hypothetical protein
MDTSKFSKGMTQMFGPMSTPGGSGSGDGVSHAVSGISNISPKISVEPLLLGGPMGTVDPNTLAVPLGPSPRGGPKKSSPASLFKKKEIERKSSSVNRGVSNASGNMTPGKMFDNLMLNNDKPLPGFENNESPNPQPNSFFPTSLNVGVINHINPIGESPVNRPINTINEDLEGEGRASIVEKK